MSRWRPMSEAPSKTLVLIKCDIEDPFTEEHLEYVIAEWDRSVDDTGRYRDGWWDQSGLPLPEDSMSGWQPIEDDES